MIEQQKYIRRHFTVSKKLKPSPPKIKYDSEHDLIDSESGLCTYYVREK